MIHHGDHAGSTRMRIYVTTINTRVVAWNRLEVITMNFMQNFKTRCRKFYQSPYKREHVARCTAQIEINVCSTGYHYRLEYQYSDHQRRVTATGALGHTRSSDLVTRGPAVNDKFGFAQAGLQSQRSRQAGVCKNMWLPQAIIRIITFYRVCCDSHWHWVFWKTNYSCTA